MIYNVFGGTLNLAQSNLSLCSFNFLVPISDNQLNESIHKVNVTVTNSILVNDSSAKAQLRQTDNIAMRQQIIVHRVLLALSTVSLAVGRQFDHVISQTTSLHQSQHYTLNSLLRISTEVITRAMKLYSLLYTYFD